MTLTKRVELDSIVQDDQGSSESQRTAARMTHTALEEMRIQRAQYTRIDAIWTEGMPTTCSYHIQKLDQHILGSHPSECETQTIRYSSEITRNGLPGAQQSKQKIRA